MMPDSLQSVIQFVPAGLWAVGVSGGADSVAMLLLLAGRADLSLHVVHLNHQTRGAHSDDDAEFVRALADRLKLPFTIGQRDEMESSMQDLPANPSARYRQMRLELFRHVVRSHGLQGVLLAHHADDQAETVLQRLIRGAGYLPLGGIQRESQVGGLRIVRPLLTVRREELRAVLKQNNQPWREDASNESDQYQRNRVRKSLAGHNELVESLVRLAETCRAMGAWSAETAPKLAESFPVTQLQNLPTILSTAAARRWLVDRGGPPQEISESIAARLVQMAEDSATPARRQFPGNVNVHRKKGRIGV
jgi:tRNA(Ile)-lysidine synthase